MINFFRKIFCSEYYKTLGARRSSQWNEVRNIHLAQNPSCVVCGKTSKLSVHHKKPFYLYKDLELVPSNLITLCESNGMNCHITFGHLGNWTRYNLSVDEDVKTWKQKIDTVL